MAVPLAEVGGLLAFALSCSRLDFDGLGLFRLLLMQDRRWSQGKSLGQGEGRL